MLHRATDGIPQSTICSFATMLALLACRRVCNVSQVRSLCAVQLQGRARACQLMRCSFVGFCRLLRVRLSVRLAVRRWLVRDAPGCGPALGVRRPRPMTARSRTLIEATFSFFQFSESINLQSSSSTTSRRMPALVCASTPNNEKRNWRKKGAATLTFSSKSCAAASSSSDSISSMKH